MLPLYKEPMARSGRASTAGTGRGALSLRLSISTIFESWSDWMFLTLCSKEGETRRARDCEFGHYRHAQIVYSLPLLGDQVVWCH